jgi:hypothetical protein
MAVDGNIVCAAHAAADSKSSHAEAMKASLD